jgi:hypothetical protein
MPTTQAQRMSRRERLLWFVLPGLLLVGAGVLVVRFVQAHRPGPDGEPEGVLNLPGGHLPKGAYHLDSGIGWGLIGVGALLVLTGLVWHAVTARNTAARQT